VPQSSFRFALASYTYTCNLRVVKRQDLERRLRELGWKPLRHGRKHDVWSKGDRLLAVPRHREINEYTAKVILRDAGELV